MDSQRQLSRAKRMRFARLFCDFTCETLAFRKVFGDFQLGKYWKSLKIDGFDLASTRSEAELGRQAGWLAGRQPAGCPKKYFFFFLAACSSLLLLLIIGRLVGWFRPSAWLGPPPARNTFGLNHPSMNSTAWMGAPFLPSAMCSSVSYTVSHQDQGSEF